MTPDDGTSSTRPGTDRIDPDVRFLLANERTLLAWMRTAIALEAGGLAVASFATNIEGRGVIGVSLLLLGALCGAFGYVRYRHADQAIRNARLPDSGRAPEFVALAVLVLGVVLAVAYLVASP